MLACESFLLKWLHSQSEFVYLKLMWSINSSNIEWKIVTKHICFLFEVPPEVFRWTLLVMMRLFILSKYFLFKTSTDFQHNTIIWASVISPTILLLIILISLIDVIKPFTFKTMFDISSSERLLRETRLFSCQEMTQTWLMQATPRIKPGNQMQWVWNYYPSFKYTFYVRWAAKNTPN